MREKHCFYIKNDRVLRCKGSLYNNSEKVDKYEKMCNEYDGTKLYSVLKKHLAKKATLLELGSGPGNDIAYFKNKFDVTGSDLSDEFLSRCKGKFKSIPFLKLDAVSIDIDKTYDCIFSNKVLHHLRQSELEESLKRQQQVIKRHGLFAHTFWLGDKEFEMDDMLFVFYDKKKLLALVAKYFSILETYEYKEFEEGDSLFIVAKNVLNF